LERATGAAVSGASAGAAFRVGRDRQGDDGQQAHQLSPYGEDAVNLAADLANRRPRSADELADRCRAAGLELDRPVTAGDLDRTQAALNAWERIVNAGGEQERADLLNRMLAEAAAYPRLTCHAGTGWHLHYQDEEQPPGAVLLTLFAVGTALHLAG
jgi:hypothetical protein